MAYYIAPPPMNPVTRILAGLVGALVLVGAFFFGLVVLAVAIGVAVLLWLLIAFRMWWLRRRWGGQFGGSGPVGGDRSTRAERREKEVIEADYEVISRREDD